MRAVRRIGWVVILVAAVAFVWTSRAALAAVTITTSEVLLAGAVVVLGVLGGAMSWAVLFPRSDWVEATRAFVIAQPAKYLPVGGLAQAISQVRLSPSAGGARRLLSHVALQVMSAAVLSAGLLATRGLVPGGWWLLGSLQILAITVIAPVLFRVLAIRLPRLFDPAISMSQAAACLVATWVPLVGGGIALDVLLGGVPEGAPGSVSAWALAWWIGFIAVPFPAGAGVRELVLVGVLGSFDAATVVASSVVLRVLMAVCEIVLFLIASVAPRRAGRSGAKRGPVGPAVGTSEQ